MSGPDDAAAIYNRLWAEARETFATGCVKADPHLLDRAGDRRRGLSLILRPSPPVIARLCALMDELNAIVPGQHTYHPDELHVTLLALINASTAFDPAAIPMDRYRAVLDHLFPQVPPFTIHLTGVTASPDTVLVTGHSDHDALNALRNRLRENLTRAGLGAALDQRYRLITTHVTVLRFQSQPDHLPELVRFLEAARQRDLGMFTVDHVEWTFNDWYMSHDVAQVWAHYSLEGDGKKP